MLKGAVVQTGLPTLWKALQSQDHVKRQNHYHRQISESNQYQIHVAEIKLEPKQVTINIPERLKYEIHSNL